MKFVQIAACNEGIVALDDQGRVWVKQPSVSSSWQWLPWKLFPQPEEEKDE